MQPDRGAIVIRMHLDVVAYLMDDPQPVPAHGVHGGLALARQGVVDGAFVLDLAYDLVAVVPDLQDPGDLA